jgi:uncharacterized membrane protein SirB2
MKDVFLLVHFLGVVIGTGAGFAVFVISYLAPAFPAVGKREVLIKLFPLRYISYIGLLLLILSGGALIGPLWAHVGQLSWFVTKMVFVAVIVAASIFGAFQMHRARRSADNNAFKLLGYAGKVSFVSSLVVVACAVFTFH